MDTFVSCFSFSNKHVISVLKDTNSLISSEELSHQLLLCSENIHKLSTMKTPVVYLRQLDSNNLTKPTEQFMTDYLEPFLPSLALYGNYPRSNNPITQSRNSQVMFSLMFPVNELISIFLLSFLCCV